MVYGDFEKLNRRTAADKVLHHKTFNIAINRKYGGYQCVIASMVYKFFDKNTSGVAAVLTNKYAVKSEIISNKDSAEELHKPIIKKFKKRKVHSPYLGCRSSRYVIDK